MRRLPIYFLVDISESMVGTPIEEVQNGMRTIIQNLRVDPYALETVFVGIIAFAGKAVTLTPLTELYKFYPPVFPVGGGTSLGKGLEALMDDIDKNVRKTTLDNKGDWKPIIFLFTDGNPTDDYAVAFRRWNNNYRRHCNLIAVSIGDNVNILTLAQITDEILLLKETDEESFAKFFKWVTASIKTTSVSVTDSGSDEVKLAPTAGINLEKVEVSKCGSAHPAEVDENFAVVHGRCQNTGQDYLIKYARHFGGRKREEYREAAHDFHLVGGYRIDGKQYAALSDGRRASINSAALLGVPSCPCCGNQHAGVVCSCGNVFCAGNEERVVCPWCGEEGYLGGGAAGGGIDLNRGLG